MPARSSDKVGDTVRGRSLKEIEQTIARDLRVARRAPRSRRR